MQHRTPFIFPGLLTVAEQYSPYRVMADFFCYVNVPEAHEYIHLWLTSAFDKGWFNSECPANLLFFYEHFCKLLEAASLFNQQDTSDHPGSQPLPDNLNELPAEHTYCQPAVPSRNWLSLPRHLTPREFYKPFEVFSEVFNYQPLQTWRVILYELLYQALSSSDYATAEMSYNLLTIQKHLLKLVEAARLIVQRGPDLPVDIGNIIAFTRFSKCVQSPSAA